MACGTPVIAWRRGAVAEIVDDGLTGFIVDNEDEAVVAIGQLSNIDRRAVRRTFEQRFTARTMAHNYLELYRRIDKYDIRERRNRIVQSARSGEQGSQGVLATDAR
jgi:glycosyltransferase involved in cell wall biosynthesis